MMDIVKYSESIVELCLKNSGQAFQIGIEMLVEDLKVAKKYEHDSPVSSYDEKNEYFDRSNVIGYHFLTKNLTGFSKDYYWRAFNEIVAFEQSQKTTLNKGMVCANWGISDLAEGDVDGGIAHLLWSGYEDRGWLKASYTLDIFDSPLYKQFAEGSNRR
jgi:hypothetical protein